MKILFTRPGMAIALFIVLAACNNKPPDAKELIAVEKKLPDENKYANTLLEEASKKLQSGNTLTKKEIDDFSKDPATRAGFFELLSEYNRNALFPTAYYNLEKAAESALVNWLVYPTELDTFPSSIALMKKVDYLQNDTSFVYYVFQFKTEAPHWAAKDGWMMGVAGPYLATTRPYDWVKGTFSRFTRIADTTPEKEVEWIHKNVYKRNPG